MKIGKHSITQLAGVEHWAGRHAHHIRMSQQAHLPPHKKFALVPDVRDIELVPIAHSNVDLRQTGRLGKRL